MKKIILLLAVFTVCGIVSNAQTLPAQIKSYLDKKYSYNMAAGGRIEWEKSNSECGKKQWLLTADFNVDGKTDYIVKLTTGHTIGTTRNIIVAFVSKGAKFSPTVLLEQRVQPEDGSEPKVGFWLVPKGGKIPACSDVPSFIAKRPAIAIFNGGDCKKDKDLTQYYTYDSIDGVWGVNC